MKRVGCKWYGFYLAGDNMKLDNYTNVKTGMPDCSICAGVGFILEEYIPGSPMEGLTMCECISRSCARCDSKGKAPYLTYDPQSEKMVPCECHEARLEIQKIENLLKISNIPPKYRYKFLSGMDISGSSMLKLLVAHDWANELIENWSDRAYWKRKKKPRQGMYLWGNTGSGKTLLACSILNELIFRYRVHCKYAKINKDFLGALRDSYNKDSQSHGKEMTIQEEFSNVEVLVIDDFGIQKDSEWVDEKLYALIDARYEKEKTTLLTSNTPISDWREKGHGRIFSRLCEMTHELHIDCPDYRLKFV